MTWTRAHDAWIAKHCEGLDVIEQDGLYLIFAGWCGKYQQEPEKLFKNVYSYNTDPAAAIRAAEAWRKKVSHEDPETDRRRIARLRSRGAEVLAGDAKAAG